MADRETPQDAARREVGEETALHNLILHTPLGVIDWYFRFRGQLIHKYCHFYLFEAPTGSPAPQREEGISACCWYPYREAVETISYDNARSILHRAGAAIPTLCPESGPPVDE